MVKKAAEEILRIADELEKEMEQVTKFVCSSCNHTATLAKINQSRKTAAKDTGENVLVSKVTVNDRISCPACDGIMSYCASEESKPYFYQEKVGGEEEEEEEEEKKEKADKEAKEEEKEEEEEEEKKASGPIDYDLLDRYMRA